MGMNANTKFSLHNNLFCNRKALFLISLLTIMLMFSTPFSAMFNNVSPFALGATYKVVNNEVELVNAVNNTLEPITIAFNNDIKLTGSLVISTNKNITLTSSHNGEFFKLIGASSTDTITVNEGGVLIIEGIIVTHERDSSGRGVAVNSGGKLMMTSGKVSGNSDIMGGGVYVHYGTFVMSGGMITNNRAIVASNQAESDQMLGQHSGGNMQHSGGMSTNSASGTGGGVYVGYDSSFSMSGGIIIDNEAALDGGGVYVDAAGSIGISGEGAIVNNNAARHGGGVYSNGGSFRITGNAVITNNTAIHRGGGVNMNSGSFSMGGGLIANNTAGTGGGVYMSLGSLCLMHGGEISGNTAIGTMPISGGGGVYNEGNFAISGGVITGNTAHNFGGGAYNNGDFKLSGEGEIYDNTALKGNNVYHYDKYNVGGYIIPVVLAFLVICIIGGLFLYFRKKGNKKKEACFSVN